MSSRKRARYCQKSEGETDVKLEVSLNRESQNVETLIRREVLQRTSRRGVDKTCWYLLSNAQNLDNRAQRNLLSSLHLKDPLKSREV